MICRSAPRLLVTPSYPTFRTKPASSHKLIFRTFATRRNVITGLSQYERFFHHCCVSQSAPARKDPYTVLGVNKDASQNDIKQSYYALARKYHPDTNKEQVANEVFVEVQAAYDVLSDETKRAAYDRYQAATHSLHSNPDTFTDSPLNPFMADGFAGFPDFRSVFSGTGGSVAADLFAHVFGATTSDRAHSRTPEHARGEDIHVSISIGFFDAAKGVQRVVHVTSVVECSTCAGSGLKAGAKRLTCSACDGFGIRRHVVDNGFQMATMCSMCNGEGSVVAKGSQCSGCRGTGRLRMRKLVSVNIPAGKCIEDGMSVRVSGEGDTPVSGQGPKGDLLLRVNVAKSTTFRRQGVHLHYEAHIPVHTALLGGRARVPTLNGDIDVAVPSGIQPTEELVIRGFGLPDIGSGNMDGKGDLYVSFLVQLPQKLSERQRAILQDYADDIEGQVASPIGKTPSSAYTANVLMDTSVE